MDPAYYIECHQVFRQATDQAERMLFDMRSLLSEFSAERILSVGCGTGLFEIPMLQSLKASGLGLRSFVGVDTSSEACSILRDRLQEAVGERIAWQVVESPFEEYEPAVDFDVVLFNHSLEYLGGRPAVWIEKAIALLRPGGICLIYSPDRGGINGPYEKFAASRMGVPPRFSADIEQALLSLGIDFERRRIAASCSLELLEQAPGTADAERLLSFLAQVDCRDLPSERVQDLASYYLGLREAGALRIPHPTTRFLIRAGAW